MARKKKIIKKEETISIGNDKKPNIFQIIIVKVYKNPKVKILNFLKKIKEFTSKPSDTGSNLNSFFGFIVGYGLIINYMLWGIWHLPFSWKTFPAYGILVYFIREELGRWIRGIRK